MTAIHSILIQIERFIRTYYKNQLFKGFLLLIMVFVFSLCLVSTLEFFGKFNSGVRFFLLASFTLLNSWIICYFTLIPVLKLLKLRKGMSTIEASKIIGDFFPEISDKLTNVLQLNNDINASSSDTALLEAGVNQKIKQIGVFTFNNAIDYTLTKKYIKYTIPFVFMFLFLVFYTPSLFTQGSFRILNFTEEFKEKVPFTFNLNNTSLSINEGEDLIVELVLKGKNYPDKVFVYSDNGSFLMVKKSKNVFHTVIKKPVNKSAFYFYTSKYKSQEYQINVLGKSILGKLDAHIVYPEYIAVSNKTIKNATDLSIPEGSMVVWKGLTKNTSSVNVVIDTTSFYFNKKGFSFRKKINNAAQLEITLINDNTNQKDTINYALNVIHDEFPIIQVSEQTDSINSSVKYFKGSVLDDYGLEELKFHYEIESISGVLKKQEFNVKKVNGTKSSFDFSVDFSREDIQLQDRIKYFFTISDNDGVNGSKITRSSSFFYELPDLNEVNSIRDQEQENLKEDLNDILNETSEFQKELEELNKKLKNNNTQRWNNINELNELKKKQKDLLNKLQDIQNRLEESTNKKNKLSEIDKELLEKQEQIEELLNEVMDEELKKLLEELEKLLKENNKEKIKENLDEIKESTEDMKNQLDRSLEMLKKLQLNEKIDDVEKELKKLAQEQQKEASNKEKDIGKQKQITEDFENIKKKIEELQDLNKELTSPMNIEDTKKEQQEISEELSKAEEQIDKNKKKKSTESQNKAAKQMEELSEKLDSMQQSSNQEQQEEDMESLRNILESLVLLSLDQEALMDQFIKVRINDPAFRKYGRKQRRINDDTKVVRDSLMALAKRQPGLGTFIDKELNTIDFSQKETLEAVGERKQKIVTRNQQITMTSYNNLALLLNEVLQQMQNQMKSEMPGGGSCNKPGGKGRPKAGPKMNSGDMKEMLKKQLDQMKKGMQDGGNKEGGKKPGQNKGAKGQGALGSEGLAKMAAEQSAIRQRLEQLRNELNKKGQGEGNSLNPLIEELKEQQKKIINKNINKQTINRQQDILTRLLESEKALLEKGFEEKRESKTGKNTQKGNKILFEEYNKEKLKQIELLRYTEPFFKKYYKEKADEYFDKN